MAKIWKFIPQQKDFKFCLLNTVNSFKSKVAYKVYLMNFELWLIGKQRKYCE